MAWRGGGVEFRFFTIQKINGLMFPNLCEKLRVKFILELIPNFSFFLVENFEILFSVARSTCEIQHPFYVANFKPLEVWFL